jgi:cell division cycle protein 37
MVHQAGILSLEEEIIDATTEEGKDRLKKLESEAKENEAKESEAKYADDPE